MSLLTCRDSRYQTIDERVSSFAAPGSRQPSKCPALKINPNPQDAQPGGERRRGVALKKLEAENLLAWLEANGRCGKLGFVPGGGFTLC
jgi:hypothetical protein